MKRTERAAVRRQGDVLLVQTTKSPSERARKILDRGRVILAYGEQTGHAHQVVPSRGAAVLDDESVGTDNADPIPPCEQFEEADGTRILVLSRPASLVHEEHAPMDLDAGGRFEVIQQAEWGLDQVRQVAD